VACTKKNFYEEQAVYSTTSDMQKICTLFIGDSIAAFKIDSMKECGCGYHNLKHGDKGLYALNESEMDTIWYF